MVGSAQVAAAQRGLVRRGQLVALGVSARAIEYLVSVGSLHRILRGVYAVGHPALEPLAAETAALLYAGDNAVLSHGTAAGVWGLVPTPPVVAITIAGRNVRRQPHVKLHRVDTLDARDVRMKHGFPVTAPARTIIDFAAAHSADAVDRALNEARVLKLVTDAELTAALGRCRGRTGTRCVRQLLAAEHGPAITRSEAERRLRTLLRAADLPDPQFNVRVENHLVDALWPRQRLVVEVDGYGFHGHRRAFETDRRRDQELAAAGYQVIRVTWRQLTDEPIAVAARLAQALVVATPGPPEQGA